MTKEWGLGPAGVPGRPGLTQLRPSAKTLDEAGPRPGNRAGVRRHTRGRPAPVYQQFTVVLFPPAASCEERGQGCTRTRRRWTRSEKARVTKERDHDDREQQACRALPAQALGGGRHGGRRAGSRIGRDTARDPPRRRTCGGHRGRGGGAFTATRSTGQQHAVRPDLPAVAAVRAGDRRGPGGTAGGRRAGRHPGRPGRPGRGAQGTDRGPDGERQPDRRQSLRDQPGQPDHDGRLDVRRPVHRPRHHLRPDLSPGRDHQPADLAQHPHARAGPGLGVRRRARDQPGPVRARPRRQRRPAVADRLRRGARGRAHGRPTATAPTPRSSATRATTRT